MTSPDRMVPYHCPYCGGEDLRPHAEAHGAWECRECLRVFSLKFVGLLTRTDWATASGGDHGVVA
jgi:ribosomal protein L37AE/L43A